MLSYHPGAIRYYRRCSRAETCRQAASTTDIRKRVALATTQRSCDAYVSSSKVVECRIIQLGPRQKVLSRWGLAVASSWTLFPVQVGLPKITPFTTFLVFWTFSCSPSLGQYRKVHPYIGSPYNFSKPPVATRDGVSGSKPHADHVRDIVKTDDGGRWSVASSRFWKNLGPVLFYARYKLHQELLRTIT